MTRRSCDWSFHATCSTARSSACALPGVLSALRPPWGSAWPQVTQASPLRAAPATASARRSRAV